MAFATSLATVGGCQSAARTTPAPADVATAQASPCQPTDARATQAGARNDASKLGGGDTGDGHYTVPPGTQFILLPRVNYGDTPAPATGIAPGEEPGPSYPDGTVYLARAEEDGMYVTEWNLATKTIRRRVKLALVDGQASMFIRRVGDALHVLAWQYNGLISYVRLTTELRWVATTALGQVSTQDPSAIAADANLTVVAFNGLATVPEEPDGPQYDEKPGSGPHEPSGLVVASFDALGHMIAKRIVQRETGDALGAGLFDNVIVFRDQTFVLLRTRDAKLLKLIRVGRGLAVEKEVILRTPLDSSEQPVASDGLTIYSWNDRLFVQSPDAAEMIELHRWGDEMRRVYACRDAIGRTRWNSEAERDFWMGDEHVDLNGAIAIDWTHSAAHPLPPAPCPGAIPP